MKSVMNKIFSGECDEAVHSDFLKFSRGNFGNRYLVEGKKQKDKWAIKAGAEFANYLVRKGLEKASGEIAVTGIIVATFDIRDELSFEVERVKQFQGVKQFIINATLEPKKLLEVMDKFPRCFFALTFALPGFELKVKAKAPKSGKPGTKTKGEDEGPRADFCSLKTGDVSVVKDLFFDFPDFKEIRINHTVEVKEVVIPKGVTNPVEMREKSVRKGVVKRLVEIDGRKEQREAKFEC